MATDKKMAYDAAYNRDHYETILLRVPKGLKDILKDKASADGKSLNSYILSKINGQP